jgi:hypothetical protein
MEYLFSLPERDFDATLHVLTGLIDESEHPIVRCKHDPSQQNPIGFGRDNEWNRITPLPKSSLI